MLLNLILWILNIMIIIKMRQEGRILYTEELLDKLLGKKNRVMSMRPWLNWIEHLTTDQKVGGSNPLGRAIFTASFCWLFF